ncbi:hypothetical protein [Tellurirhabdus rosea]|uniref:hypothetical protein n=1 Tax=Tellurirhabdus rosea TaxID=2674997 RepID=UPI00224D96DF|nr:hypothetical protein [Tellurirhabdus rosea]
MNRFFLFVLLALIGLSGCKPGHSPEPEPVEPVSFPVGNPTAAQTTFTVTPAGGTFSSPDQTLKITIPAGAVSTNTQISIQPIENTCPAGAGQGFRLLPHGIQFAKPVTLTFSYQPFEQQVSMAEALGVAYQDDKGLWRLVARPVVNEAAKTVSVTTTHFSDWIAALWYQLIPQSTMVAAGNFVELRVITFLPDLLGPLAPPTTEDRAMSNARDLEAEYIKNNGKGDAWRLGGVGRLSPAGASAIYTAPASIDKPTTVNVTVELNTRGTNVKDKYLLVSSITVLPQKKAGITFRIDGGPWQFLPCVTDYIGGRIVNSTHYGIGAQKEGVGAIDIYWMGGVGEHPWDTQQNPPPEHLTTFLGATPDHPFFESSYKPGPNADLVTSGGTITIEKLGNVGEEISGKFSVKKAGVFAAGQQIRTVNIEGFFYGLRAN